MMVSFDFSVVSTFFWGGYSVAPRFYSFFRTFLSDFSTVSVVFAYHHIGTYIGACLGGIERQYNTNMDHKKSTCKRTRVSKKVMQTHQSFKQKI